MDEVEKKGLLVIPDSVKQSYQPPPSTGIVVQMGDEVNLYRKVLEPGDMVMFSKFAGTDFSIDQEAGFKILDTKEIMCTLVDTEQVVAPVEE